jgi:hypothetical protein
MDDCFMQLIVIRKAGWESCTIAFGCLALNAVMMFACFVNLAAVTFSDFSVKCTVAFNCLALNAVMMFACYVNLAAVL